MVYNDFMKYISNFKKLAKIKEMANGGDEKAKDFLFGFMDMSDDEVNAYLSSVAVDEEKEPDFKLVVKSLIDDENEAVGGYDKAIKLLTNSNLENKDSIIEKLNHIKEEELEHIEELKEVL